MAAARTRRRHAIRIATFNIHHGAGPDDVLDLEHTAEVIAATDADVVAVQEVDRHFRDRSDWKDQAGELARMLAMRVVFGANIDLDPLEPGQPRRQYGCAILTQGAILSWRNTWLAVGRVVAAKLASSSWVSRTGDGASSRVAIDSRARRTRSSAGT